MTVGTASRALLIGISINIAYALAEVAVGIRIGSMGLVADAGHNLSDVAGLLLALIAVRLAARKATAKYTFGYRKASILISLLNALLLLAAVVGIIRESIERFLDPQPVAGWGVAATAAAGVAVNYLSARLLRSGKERDLNIRGAYLHMILDALVSVGVVVSGIVISLTGWNAIDPIIGIVVAGIIVYSSWNLLTASFRLAVDGVPDGIDVASIEQALLSIDGIRDVHHIHIWGISTTQNAMTAHLVVDDLSSWESVRRRAKHLLAEHGIDHSTLEIETEAGRDSSCDGC
ncbi:MAG: cation diffusion facilitator family transporter [Alistipes sp.]|nr:cation diffusion facilitator family transporter [Alistipes sp.]